MDFTKISAYLCTYKHGWTKRFDRWSTCFNDSALLITGFLQKVSSLSLPYFQMLEPTFGGIWHRQVESHLVLSSQSSNLHPALGLWRVHRARAFTPFIKGLRSGQKAQCLVWQPFINQRHSTHNLKGSLRIGELLRARLQLQLVCWQRREREHSLISTVICKMGKTNSIQVVRADFGQTCMALSKG